MATESLPGRIAKIMEAWRDHLNLCRTCASFDSSPSRLAKLDPCPRGRQLIQYLLRVLREGL